MSYKSSSTCAQLILTYFDYRCDMLKAQGPQGPIKDFSRCHDSVTYPFEVCSMSPKSMNESSIWYQL